MPTAKEIQEAVDDWSIATIILTEANMLVGIANQILAVTKISGHDTEKLEAAVVLLKEHADDLLTEEKGLQEKSVELIQNLEED